MQFLFTTLDGEKINHDPKTIFNQEPTMTWLAVLKMYGLSPNYNENTNPEKMIRFLEDWLAEFYLKKVIVEMVWTLTNAYAVHVKHLMAYAIASVSVATHQSQFKSISLPYRMFTTNPQTNPYYPPDFDVSELDIPDCRCSEMNEVDCLCTIKSVV